MEEHLCGIHRHCSHLLPIFPLCVLDRDNPGDRELIRKSVEYWWGLFTDPQKKGESYFGYTQTGASCMFALMSRGDDALAARAARHENAEAIRRTEVGSLPRNLMIIRFRSDL
jgi:hypothetical protein